MSRRRGTRRRAVPTAAGARRALGTLLVVGLVVALGFWTLQRLPDVTTARLPGAAGGSDTYPVEVRFADVLDLVPNSTVRVADVPVGRVTTIDVEPGGARGHVAVVQLEIDSDHDLPAGTAATIRSTSLLGEKYVALTAPDGGTGSLAETGEIPLERTGADVEVEQVLASLGAVLNGGGLQQLSTITRELSTALAGREGDTRALLGDLDDIVGRLDAGRDAIVTALESTARLSRVLADQRAVIGRAIEDLDPAFGVLARQQEDLTSALVSLRTLDEKATGVIRRSTRATVADLEALVPVTRELGKVASLLPENLTLLVTYPFADNSVPAFSGAYGAVKGTVVIDLEQLLTAVVPTSQDAPADEPQDDDGPRGPRLPEIRLPDLIPDLDLPELDVPGALSDLDALLDPLRGGAR